MQQTNCKISSPVKQCCDMNSTGGRNDLSKKLRASTIDSTLHEGGKGRRSQNKRASFKFRMRQIGSSRPRNSVQYGNGSSQPRRRNSFRSSFICISFKNHFNFSYVFQINQKNILNFKMTIISFFSVVFLHSKVPNIILLPTAKGRVFSTIQLICLYYQLPIKVHKRQ